jgi:nicotinamidase-related amidase
MPITAIDPQTALLVVDLQKGILAYATSQPIGEVVERAAELAKAFRAKGLPVVLINVAGGAPGRAEQSRRIGEIPPEMMEFAPELDQQPSDHVVTKRTWGAFTATDLDAWLKSKGVTGVVVCGVATAIGVESTARQAHEAGYNVTLAIDAMTDLSAETHANSIQRIFPRLGETGTAAEVISHL